MSWDDILAPFTGPDQATLYPDGSWTEINETGLGIRNTNNNATCAWADVGTAIWNVEGSEDDYRIQVSLSQSGYSVDSRLRVLFRHPDDTGPYNRAGYYWMEFGASADAVLMQGNNLLHTFDGGNYGYYTTAEFEIRVRNIMWLAGAAPHVRIDLIDLGTNEIIGYYVDDALTRCVSGRYVGISILGNILNSKTEFNYFNAHVLKDAMVMATEYSQTYADLTVNPSFAIPEQVRYLGYSLNSEYGYEQRSPRHNRARKVWRLVWDSLNETDYETLRDFFDGCLGALRPFRWIDVKSEDWNIGAFIESELNVRRSAPGVYVCSAAVVEIYEDPDWANMSVPSALNEIEPCHTADYEEYEQFILEAGTNEATVWSDAETEKLIVPPGYYKINYHRGGVSWRTVAGVDEYDCSKVRMSGIRVDTGGVTNTSFAGHTDYPTQREFYASQIASPLSVSLTLPKGGILSSWLNTGSSPTAKDSVLLSVCRKPYAQCVSPLPEIPGATTGAYGPSAQTPENDLLFEPIDMWDENDDFGYVGTYEKFITLTVDEHLAADLADARQIGGTPKGIIYYLPPWAITGQQAFLSNDGPYRFPNGDRTVYRSGYWCVYVRVYDCQLYHSEDAYGQRKYSYKGVHFGCGDSPDDGGEMYGTPGYFNDPDYLNEWIRCQDEYGQPGFWRKVGDNLKLDGQAYNAHPIETYPDANGIYQVSGLGNNDWELIFWLNEGTISDPSAGGYITLLITAWPTSGPLDWGFYTY